MSNSASVEEVAARWLLRGEEASWSSDDQIELDKWLNSSIEHKIAFWRLEYGWRRADRLAALNPLSAGPAHRPRRLWRASAAAVPLAACLILCVLMVSRMDFARHKTYVTEIGARETVPLADGTQIELNSGTTLRATVKGQVREVWLDQGEVYFEVVHDPARPFVVHVGSRTLTDLGTKFSVRRNDAHLEVIVVSGRVQLDNEPDASSSVPVTLARGDIATIEGASTFVVPSSIDRIDDLLSWRHGLLVFDQSTLADAASEFNRYNRKKLLISDSTVARMRISGRFESSNLDGFTRLLHLAYGLNASDDGTAIKISE
jgi:transmembrane sensor